MTLRIGPGKTMDKNGKLNLSHMFGILIFIQQTELIY